VHEGLAFTTAWALDGEALLGVLGADLQRAAAHAEEAIAHRIEHSLADSEVGLGLLDEAIQTAEITSERFFEAELHRLRGEMLLSLGKKAEAEAGLRRALTIAQQQQARWWELRGATSLAKHWHDQGRSIEARSLLKPVYSWFIKGFDTTYLKNARALLDELKDLSGPQMQAGRK
jgi:predicted ATPase